MGGLIGKLLGSEKALSGVVSGVTNGLDALVYTEEEKASDAAADRSEARKRVVEWMSSTEGQNLARRLIALVVTGVWLFMYLVAAALNVAGVWVADPATAERVMETAQVIGERAYEMNGAMMLILGFYFAAPHMGEIVGAALGKFSGKAARTKG